VSQGGDHGLALAHAVKGAVVPFVPGLGLDALTLAATILTVVAGYFSANRRLLGVNDSATTRSAPSKLSPPYTTQ
jgi:hypothetical protein